MQSANSSIAFADRVFVSEVDLFSLDPPRLALSDGPGRTLM